MFALVNPEVYFRKLGNSIGDTLKRFKSLTLKEKDPKATVVRNLCLGQPAGTKDNQSSLEG